MAKVTVNTNWINQLKAKLRLYHTHNGHDLSEVVILVVVRSMVSVFVVILSEWLMSMYMLAIEGKSMGCGHNPTDISDSVWAALRLSGCGCGLSSVGDELGRTRIITKYSLCNDGKS